MDRLRLTGFDRFGGGSDGLGKRNCRVFRLVGFCCTFVVLIRYDYVVTNYFFISMLVKK